MSEFHITKPMDSSSPKIFQAAAEGTNFSFGDVEFFKSSFSTTLPYLDVHFTNALITSVQATGSGGEFRTESLSIVFSQVTMQYAANPTNPFAAILPLSSQVQDGPFSLNFAYDLATDDAVFGNSDILMDATIAGPLGSVPEPSSLLLLGSGLAGVAVVCRKWQR